MARLKSRTQCCVGGFMFTQPETGMDFHGWDFENLCRQIAAHRQANPRFNLSTDMDAIRNEVDAANAARMQSIPGADSYIVKEQAQAPFFPKPRSRNEGAVAGVKAVASGARVLTDWLGDGGVPVPHEQAESRAGVCAVCPQNQGGDWMSLFTAPVSAMIRAQMSKRTELGLSTSHDAKLEICNACKCPLKLKVHAPLKHIAAHLSDEIKGKLDAQCWVLKELAS